MSRFKKDPVCEVCQKNPAMSFAYIEDQDGSRWKFCCECTSDNESYYIVFDKFFGSAPSVVDWLAHMHGKNWMDWNDFMDMMTRFRIATSSFGT